jgi:outer membrane immunogenic protein
MKKLLLATTALIASAGIAFAADLPHRQAAPAPMLAPAFTWTGVYAGVHGGYAWGEGKVSFFGPTFKNDISGGFGGIQLGYNQQVGHIVLGLEADVSAGDIGNSSDFGGGFTTSSRINWMGTIRARAGYAFDRFLPYVTGGVAIAKNKFNLGAFGLSSEQTHTGWVIGAGVEYAITSNWSAKVEYLYADFGKESYFDDILPGGVNIDAHVNSVKAGVNYRF